MLFSQVKNVGYQKTGLFYKRQILFYVFSIFSSPFYIIFVQKIKMEENAILAMEKFIDGIK